MIVKPTSIFASTSARPTTEDNRTFALTMKLQLLLSALLVWATGVRGEDVTDESVGEKNVKNIAIVGR